MHKSFEIPNLFGDIMELLIFCPFVIFFSLFIILAIGIILYGIQRSQVRTERWQLFASQTGLIFEAGGLVKEMRVSGNYRGYQVLIDTFSHHTGYSTSHSYPYTRISITITNAMSVDLKIQKNRPLFLSKDTFQINDSQIDQLFIFSGSSYEMARNIFTDINLRHRILQTRSLNLEIAGQNLIYTHPGVEKDVDRLIFLLELMCDLAKYVDQK